MCIQSMKKYCLNFCASVNNSHLGVFLWELSINYAVSQQEWRTLKGNSLFLSYQVNKQEMGTSKLRVHSLVYESDDSHTRHPCDLHKPIATRGHWIIKWKSPIWYSTHCYNFEMNQIGLGTVQWQYLFCHVQWTLVWNTMCSSKMSSKINSKFLKLCTPHNHSLTS